MVNVVDYHLQRKNRGDAIDFVLFAYFDSFLNYYIVICIQIKSFKKLERRTYSANLIIQGL